MLLSDISVKRPVFATVISLLLIAFGIIAFNQLPLREYPDISSPIVSISTDYRGAAAAIVETKVTQVLEDRISVLKGIKKYLSLSVKMGVQKLPLNLNYLVISMQRLMMSVIGYLVFWIICQRKQTRRKFIKSMPMKMSLCG
jgi:multidrug efflux pump subunit AcrB